MSLALANKRAMLRDRAAMFAKARIFFAERKVLEVDVPLLQEFACVDAHIDLITAKVNNKKYYLHSSPEYGMKKLLAQQVGDIYQLAHVYRDNERGSRHRPEFMMAEWYRMGFTFEEMIEETAEFLRLFIEPKEKRVEVLTYREAFDRFVGFYPDEQIERDLHFAFKIEPNLGIDKITCIRDFPLEGCALAKIENGVALRFELFYQATELANGYFELTDPVEQEARLHAQNALRHAMGKETYPIDKEFIGALRSGIDSCAGVAVGFDRLMMVRHGVITIDEVLPL